MSVRRRRIAVVTGSRAEYGVLRTILRGIADHPRLSLELIACGMHLLPRFGRTVRDIRADGWPIAALIPMQRGDDDPLDQARAISRGVAGVAKYLSRSRPDALLVLGDRVEAMAAALAAVATATPLVHVHGGDVAEGDFDDSLRHAITKLANFHLTASQAARRRVIRLGERPSHVFCIGAPGLDELHELPPRRAPRPGRALSDTKGRAALVVYHGYGRSAAVEQRVAGAILDAARDAGLRRWIIHPNTDRGHSGVLRAIERHVRLHGSAAAGSDVRVIKSLPRREYIELLCSADVLIGNSSSGLIEAPFVGTPTVNVGARQAGREPGGASVLHAAETPADIRRALRRALAAPRRPARRGPYGNGTAGRKAAAILARVSLDRAATRKRITY
ncbi:MAG: UDP-N,N'-diacetylbacillosamine 2-epimerase (hydrolyzing) [Phycisphaerae bacterium]|nr:UDP-N,N'-diacetylbacillosamine 2-epimerase (hydrolyzing) [Phycisphaerae bacterium]